MVVEKSIVNRRESWPVRFHFKALSPVKLCTQPDPMGQFGFQLSRGGTAVPLDPLVVMDPTELLERRPQVRVLQPGQTATLRGNLKRLKPAQPWQPGEYTVRSTFHLCEQTELSPLFYEISGPDIPIPVQNTARFLVID